MFGKIIGFDDSKLILENINGQADTNYIGYHLVFAEGNRKIVGEIVSLDKQKIVVLPIGEIVDDKFSNGVLRKPSMNTVPRIIYKNELESLLGNQNYLEKNTLLFGTSAIYKDFFVTSRLNDFFANHFAIIGNSGSGKSCSVARLIQNIFYTSSQEVPKNAHICLFDIYGEYYNTFNELDNFPGLHFKKYTTQQDFGDASLLQIPPYFLEADDLAILLNAESTNQLPVLDKAIRLVRIFRSKDPKAEEYKNDIIARTCLDILSSGKPSAQIRDQLISVLSSYNTKTLNLNSIISQPGYDRTLRQCLNIDDQGKINTMNLVVEFMQQYAKVSIDKIKLEEDISYSLSDLYFALEFALINEGSLTNAESFAKNNVLKSRLQSIINSKEAAYFKYDGVISKDQFVIDFFKTLDTNETAQLVDINLSFLEDSMAKCITKIFSKLFFEFTTKLDNRGSFSIHILLEEAHRYVKNDSDTEIIGYNIFDRITKEGRKYGTILGFITQRPNELSKTALSQCSNFIVFRLFYPEDLNVVKGMSSNVTDETINRIKTLHPGMGMVFGTAFKVPVLTNFPLPNPMPISTSLEIDNVWYK